MLHHTATTFTFRALHHRLLSLKIRICTKACLEKSKAPPLAQFTRAITMIGLLMQFRRQHTNQMESIRAGGTCIAPLVVGLTWGALECTLLWQTMRPLPTILRLAIHYRTQPICLVPANIFYRIPTKCCPVKVSVALAYRILETQLRQRLKLLRHAHSDDIQVVLLAIVPIARRQNDSDLLEFIYARRIYTAATYPAAVKFTEKQAI